MSAKLMLGLALASCATSENADGGMLPHNCLDCSLHVVVLYDDNAEVVGDLRLQLVRLIQGFCRDPEDGGTNHYVYARLTVTNDAGESLELDVADRARAFGRDLRVSVAGTQDLDDGSQQRIAMVSVEGLPRGYEEIETRTGKPFHVWLAEVEGRRVPPRCEPIRMKRPGSADTP